MTLAKHATEEMNNQRSPLGKTEACPDNQRILEMEGKEEGVLGTGDTIRKGKEAGGAL